MGEKGKLIGIAVRATRHGPMQEISATRVSTEAGVGADARGLPGRRQATVITREGWQAACSELGSQELPWITRRANLLIDGVDLKGKVGYDLRIGDAVLSITGETRPCEVMNRARPGLMVALQPDWRAGVTCRVIKSGDVTVGSEVVLSRNRVRQLTTVSSNHVRRLTRRSRAMASALLMRKRTPQEEA